MEIPGNPVVSEVVLAADVVVGSEGTVPEDDVQKSPFHLSTIFKETLPLQHTKGEVHRFSVVATEKSNCVRCLLRCTSQGPTEKKKNSVKTRDNPEAAPQIASPKPIPEIQP
jgi:hypothetical protein